MEFHVEVSPLFARARHHGLPSFTIVSNTSISQSAEEIDLLAFFASNIAFSGSIALFTVQLSQSCEVQGSMQHTDQDFNQKHLCREATMAGQRPLT